MRLGNYALALMMAAVIAVPADVGATTYNEYRDSLGVRDVQGAKAGGFVEEAAKDGTYSYPQKYYLEHYYIRPSAQQIQFLSELEVTGRPSNAIKERPYSASHWENLVPGSIEDDIYHKVVESMKEYSKNGKRGGISTRDAVEEYLRISL